MSAANIRALNKVLRTLSAVRTTLSDEEQAILDELVLRAGPEEVTVHGSGVKPGPAPSARAVSNIPEEEDVTAHGSGVKPGPAPSARAVSNILGEEDASARMMTYQGRLTISLDSNGAYQVSAG